jgi:hypothetical protein
MSMTAQSRDLSDPTTSETFAARVQTLERLKLLLILTVCDIRAVGPGVWNGWKGQLLRTLYYETEIILTGGHSEAAREQRVTAAQAMLFEALPDWSEEERVAYAAMHYPPYWLRTDLDRKIAHAHLIKNADEAGQAFATLTAVHSFEGVTEIVVYTPDHPRLLSTIAAACVAAKSDIVGAQIHTTSTGKALDTILIRQEFEQEADERRRADRIAATLESAMKGDVHLPPMMAEKGAAKGRVKAFKVPPEVMIDNQGSERFTVIEAAGRDRPGLLHDLASALSDLSLDTHSAHVATFGERAVDVFYVTDLMGHKVTQRAKLNAVKKRLEEVLGGTPGKPRPAALARRGRGNAAVPEPSEPAPSTPAPRPRPAFQVQGAHLGHGAHAVSLLRNFATVGGATLTSRVLGFVRDILMAAALGTGPVADAFVVAFRFPNLFRRLFAEGAFNSAFVPLFARTLEGEGRDAAKAFAQEAMAGLLTVLALVTAVAMIAMPLLMLVLAPGFIGDPDKFDLTVFLTRITFPYLTLVSSWR